VINWFIGASPFFATVFGPGLFKNMGAKRDWRGSLEDHPPAELLQET